MHFWSCGKAGDSGPHGCHWEEPTWKSAVGYMNDGGRQMVLFVWSHMTVHVYKLLFGGSVFSVVSMSVILQM